MSLKDYEILSKIGEGAYSTVMKVKRLSDQKIYALKKVRLSKLKEKEKRNALNEVRLLASIKHPNVISYKQAFFDDESHCLCLIMEFADGGDLYQKIQLYQKKGTYMSESFIWSLIIQLARGLKALHDLNVVHRDLKSANVFLTIDGKVKLGDMNVSKVAKGRLEHTQTGTPYYASPEVWKDVPYDSKSDLWSLGCVIYEAACLKPPFRADDMQGLYKKVIKGEYPSLPRTFSQELHHIISRLLQTNPDSRISCEELLVSPSVVQHSKDVVPQNTENLLLKTIVFPSKLSKITDQLPGPNFDDLNSAIGMIPNFPKVGNRSLILRETPEPAMEPPRGMDHSEKYLYNLKQYRKMILKDNYGALKLPKVRLPFQKYSTSKAANPLPTHNVARVHRVKSEKISRKPSTNRSLLAAYRIQNY